MKAMTHSSYGEPDVLQLRDIEQPTPGPDEVLVAVEAAGVDQGVWHLLAGKPRVARLALGLRAPERQTPGADLSGRVQAVGSRVTRFSPGDEVFGAGSGSFAEFALATESKLAHKPAALSFPEAAVLPISGLTALHAVRDAARVSPGQRVLVLGAGEASAPSPYSSRKPRARR